MNMEWEGETPSSLIHMDGNSQEGEAPAEPPPCEGEKM